MDKQCQHLDQITDSVQPVTPNGCQECLETGDPWVNQRLCLTCGHVGCCNSSMNKHATKHFEATGHPIVQAYNSKDGDWRWCYADEMMLPEEVPAGGR